MKENDKDSQQTMIRYSELSYKNYISHNILKKK